MGMSLKIIKVFNITHPCIILYLVNKAISKAITKNNIRIESLHK